MGKPRIFLGSSAQQEKLLLAVARGLSDIAEIQPWTTSFNPGVLTLDRLLELTRQVDFAVFIFGQDDWTTVGPGGVSHSAPGRASPRDNVVFEAGLFGGVLGMRRTFILHAHGAKMPTDLLGLTLVRYSGEPSPTEMRTVNQKIRDAIADEGRIARLEGQWWQFSLSERTEQEPAALSLMKIARGRDGALDLTGRSWQADGRLCVRYWSVAAKQQDESSGLFYYWRGERPLDLNAPQLDGIGEIKLESADRGSGYFVTRSVSDPNVNLRTSGVYWRAEADDIDVLDGRDEKQRAALIATRLREWEALRND